MIGAFRSLSFSLENCSLGGPPWYRSAAVLFDRGHPCFWNFNSVIPVDVIRVKSYVSSLFNGWMEKCGVRSAECGVRSAEYGKWGVWKMRSMESAEYGK